MDNGQIGESGEPLKKKRGLFGGVQNPIISGDDDDTSTPPPSKITGTKISASGGAAAATAAPIEERQPFSWSMPQLEPRQWLLIAALFAGLIFMFRSMLQFAWGQWFEETGYYQHGIFAPLLAGYMVWKRWDDLKKIEIKPAAWGPVLIVIALLFGWRAYQVSSNHLGELGFMLFIIGACGYTLGSKMTRALTMPIVILAFMLPLPENILNDLTNHLQGRSTTVAVKMLDLFGFHPTLTEGSVITMDNYQLVVGVPCSGFKLTMALLMFAVFFCSISKFTWWRLIVMVALSVPIAIVVNSWRIAMIGVFGETMGEAAGKWFHDYGSYLELVFAYGALFYIARILESPKVAKADPVLGKYGWHFGGLAFLAISGLALLTGHGEDYLRALIGLGVLAAVLGVFLGIVWLISLPFRAVPTPKAPITRAWAIAVMLLVGAGILAATPRTPMAERRQPFYASKIPDSFGSYVLTRTVPTDPENDRATWDALQPDGIVEKVYKDRDGHDMDFLMLAGRSNSAFHDPQVCFRNQGWKLQAPQIRKMRLDSIGRDVDVNLVSMESENGQQATAVYFFRSPLGFTAKPLIIMASLFGAKTLGISMGEGFFYRVILIHSSGDRDKDFQVITRFTSDMLGQIKANLPDAVGE